MNQKNYYFLEKLKRKYPDLASILIDFLKELKYNSSIRYLGRTVTKLSDSFFTWEMPQYMVFTVEDVDENNEKFHYCLLAIAEFFSKNEDVYNFFCDQIKVFLNEISYNEPYVGEYLRSSHLIKIITPEFKEKLFKEISELQRKQINSNNEDEIISQIFKNLKELNQAPAYTNGVLIYLEPINILALAAVTYSSVILDFELENMLFFEPFLCGVLLFTIYHEFYHIFCNHFKYFAIWDIQKDNNEIPLWKYSKYITSVNIFTDYVINYVILSILNKNYLKIDLNPLKMIVDLKKPILPTSLMVSPLTIFLTIETRLVNLYALYCLNEAVYNSNHNFTSFENYFYKTVSSILKNRFPIKKVDSSFCGYFYTISIPPKAKASEIKDLLQSDSKEEVELFVEFLYNNKYYLLDDPNYLLTTFAKTMLFFKDMINSKNSIPIFYNIKDLFKYLQKYGINLSSDKLSVVLTYLQILIVLYHNKPIEEIERYVYPSNLPQNVKRRIAYFVKRLVMSLPFSSSSGLSSNKSSKSSEGSDSTYSGGNSSTGNTFTRKGGNESSKNNSSHVDGREYSSKNNGSYNGYEPMDGNGPIEGEVSIQEVYKKVKENLSNKDVKKEIKDKVDEAIRKSHVRIDKKTKEMIKKEGLDSATKKIEDAKDFLKNRSEKEFQEKQASSHRGGFGKGMGSPIFGDVWGEIQNIMLTRDEKKVLKYIRKLKRSFIDLILKKGFKYNLNSKKYFIIENMIKSYTKTSYIPLNIKLLPAIASPITVIVDTSGSISKETLLKVGALISKFSQGLPEIRLILYTSEVYYDKTIPTNKLKRELENTVIATGGTSLDSVFDYLDKKGIPKDSVIVILSDFFDSLDKKSIEIIKKILRQRNRLILMKYYGDELQDYYIVEGSPNEKKIKRILSMFT